MQYGDVTLIEDSDFTVDYSENVHAGTAKVTVKGLKNYTGTAEETFNINKADQTVTITAESTSIKAGAATMVAGTTTGDGAISYTSSDQAVATVSSDGEVTGVGAGTVTITASAKATTDYNAASASVEINVGPVAPTITSVTNTASGVKIKWGRVSGADGYIIYRKVSGGDYSRIGKITSGSTLSYTDTSVSGNKTYYYKILAYTVFTGSDSDVVIKSVRSSAKKILYLSPGKITSLRNTTDGMKVSWEKVSGASGYYIYRKVAGGTYKQIYTVIGGSTTTIIDSKSAKTGTVYYYAVKPYASDGTTGSYISAGKVRLCTPKLTSVKNSSSKKMTVKWSKKSNVTGYQIQYSTSSTFSSGNKTVTVVGSSKKSKTISGLTRGKWYYVRIRTYKTINGTNYYSDWSTKKSVKIS